MTRELRFGDQTKAPAFRLRQVEWQEWWLWASAIVITLVLTFGIFSLTFPGPHLPSDTIYSINLKEWVRGLAALVLLFNLYIVYQQRQLQRIRRQLAEREQLFQVITENAADMIAVIDRSGQRVYNSPAYEGWVVGAGYEKAKDLYTYALDVRQDFPPLVAQAPPHRRPDCRGVDQLDLALAGLGFAVA